MADQVRLGGMALENGVLVHGPRHWGCAVRTEDGELRVASGRKPLRAADVEIDFLRGPARLAEVFALLPVVRRALPDARLPYERPGVAGALLAAAAAARRLRRADTIAPTAQELLAATVSLAPAAVAIRGGDLAAYHGAEHIAIGSYEHGEPRPREHERCGSHLVGPMLALGVAGSVLARAAPPALRPLARLGAAFGAMSGSVELFSWAVRNPEHPFARLLWRPGFFLQTHVLTAEPSQEQLEAAETALRACLDLESPADGDRDGDAPEAPAT
jgi:uncharacterized protein YqhQ